MNEAYNHDVLLSLTTVSACHKSGFWRVHHLASVLQCSECRARETINLLERGISAFISSDLWLLDSIDLNPVDSS